MTTVTQAYELQNRATYSQLVFAGDLDAAYFRTSTEI